MMNNLYSNISDRFNFHNKLTATSALLISLIYLLSITLTPIASGIINSKYNIKQNFYSAPTKLNVNATATIDTITYINNGQMVARQIDDNNLQSYIADAKGSVLKLNSTDKSQNQTYSYDAYGKPIPATNPVLNIINPFMYNGERYDNNTALQYLRARFYNVDTKRFINQDTYDLLNRFGYVDGNPVTGVDPSGHMFESAIFSIKRFFSRNFGIAISGETIKAAYARGERDFDRMNLAGADLTVANLSMAHLSRANLHGADLSLADLRGANLHGADLRWANLHGADLSWANLHGADLRGISFFGVIVDHNTELDPSPFVSRAQHYLYDLVETRKAEQRRMERNIFVGVLLRGMLVGSEGTKFPFGSKNGPSGNVLKFLGLR